MMNLQTHRTIQKLEFLFPTSCVWTWMSAASSIQTSDSDVQMFITTRAGKSEESGKLLPGEFDHLEGNYDFSHKEIT